MNDKKIFRKKHEIDAGGKTVGRTATRVVTLLMGKNKANYAPQIDAGDYVTVVNASKLKFTGKKLEQKDYYHHTQYPGGLRRTPMKKVFENKPEKVIEHAVFRMLPKNKLRKERMKRLTVKP